MLLLSSIVFLPVLVPIIVEFQSRRLPRPGVKSISNDKLNKYP